MNHARNIIPPGSLCGVHLDLKYHLPNKACLMEWVRELPAHGINALLIEYEDAFPYRCYPFLPAPDAFTPDELRDFLALVREVGLLPIPLVQTYGHLEFALSHPGLAHLRETPEIMTKICTRKTEAVDLVRTMAAEVLEYHRDDPYVHLGADEVGNSGWCDACERRIGEIGAVRLWAEHEKPLLEWVIAQGKRPMVWDDVFWKDPQSISAAGLPPETILHTWGYNTTSLKPRTTDSGDLEFGGSGGVLRRVDAYRSAGFDCIAGPCFNWGVLFPRHSHCLANTQAWAQKMRISGLLGMVNTAWAVFHMPLQMTNLHVAATGALCRDPEANLDARWQAQWLGREFGCPADDVPAALEVLGESWEIPTPAYGRPFTPLPYSYMNMVFHYPGRQQERNARGAYPADWNEIDFVAIYRRGVEAGWQGGEHEKILEVLNRKLETYSRAVAVLRALAANASRKQSQAEMMKVFAEVKFMSLKVFAFIIRGEGKAAELLQELMALEAPFRKALAQAWEPRGQARLWRALYEPMLVVMKEKANHA